MLKSRLPEIEALLHKEVEAALVESGDLVTEEAQALVPVKTGRLHDNIKPHLVEEGVEVRAGTKRVFYGHLVEHGHRSVDGGWVPAHPFLVPALESQRAEIQRRLILAIRKAVK